MKEIKWWDEHDRLWKKWVPKSGQANTVQGELIRCAGKLADEAYRNGNINWGRDHVKMTKYLETTLDDADTFDADQRSRIQAAAAAIVRDYETPDTSGHGSAYYLLSEMAVRWCLAHPQPIPRDPDSTLHR